MVRQILAEPNQLITLELDAVAPQACCPLWQQASSRVHSRYAHTLHDLPWSGVPVRLLVHVRRFRCWPPGCPRVIFAERFCTLTPPDQQHTSRSTAVLRTLVTALGSRGGARLAPDLQVHPSASSLQRLLGRVTVPSSGTRSSVWMTLSSTASRPKAL
ncbi:transposase family protein [Deinococcus apachensis]|uniref:transposase family protein n=1 Tax=Deinococcus apachensis TaxID=309886 RepID=UPI003CCBD67D